MWLECNHSFMPPFITKSFLDWKEFDVILPWLFTFSFKNGPPSICCPSKGRCHKKNNSITTNFTCKSARVSACVNWHWQQTQKWNGNKIKISNTSNYCLCLWARWAYWMNTKRNQSKRNKDLCVKYAAKYDQIHIFCQCAIEFHRNHNLVFLFFLLLCSDDDGKATIAAAAITNNSKHLADTSHTHTQHH